MILAAASAACSALLMRWCCLLEFQICLPWFNKYRKLVALFLCQQSSDVAMSMRALMVCSGSLPCLMQRATSSSQES